MEGEAAEAGRQAPSGQRSVWRNIQERTKPFLSPKLGSERRAGGDAKKESGGMWMLRRKKKKQVLDRVFSSSQPNLCCSAPAPLDAQKEQEQEQEKEQERPSLDDVRGAAESPGGGVPPEHAEPARPRASAPPEASGPPPSHRKGSACVERLAAGINPAGPSDASAAPQNPGMYQLDVLLKKGRNLAIRDRGGSPVEQPAVEVLRGSC